MKNNSTTLFLAPMEGVTDFVMRDLLTNIGGIDHCVTEFIRVTNQLLPPSVFYNNCPELKMKSLTRSGVPVFIQLLGGKADYLAANANRAVELGAIGIDLNFGCPAKTVNRHDGGATLLKSSNRIFDIVSTVRKSIPENIPVTAKIRLGFDDPSVCIENAIAVSEAQATWLTVHCRTKTDGYKPPAYWEWITKIKERTQIKIIANGEIWTTDDYKKCKSVTDCDSFMIGRGALRDPYIFKKIKNSMNPLQDIKNTQSEAVQLAHDEAVQLIPDFFDSCTIFANEDYATARTKQWLNQLRVDNTKAQFTFDNVKTIKNTTQFKQKIQEILCQKKY